jgi:hypothetical protein
MIRLSMVLAVCLPVWCIAIAVQAESALDYDAHVAALRQKLAGQGFTVVVEKPFVVIGDERPGVVQSRATRIVRWAVTKLKAEYFEHDPPYIIDIWLFRDRESYETHAEQFFGRKPQTPFGYYAPRHRALVMNIATGGGTLVHEIVHPFVAANFRQCPAWFNEGLGSLYEQSAERDGHIVGLTNWRLAGLQQAIRLQQTITFEQLAGTTTAEFYGDNSGLHYAMARYLCYYLQEHGKLREYYHAFRQAADAGEDRTGYATLAAVLGEADMAAFQKQWEAWVMTLQFP